MKRTICLLLTALMLMGILAGCQKTPETPFVVGKNTEKLVEAAQSESTVPQLQIHDDSESPLHERFGIPKTYSAELEPYTDKVSVSVNATINLPVVTGMPTIRIKARDFTQDEITRLFTALCGDTIMYRARNERTKAEIEAEMIAYQQSVANNSGTSNPDILKAYQDQYEKAPDSIEDVVCDGTLYQTEMQGDVHLGTNACVDACEFPARPEGGKQFSVINNCYDLSSAADWGDERGANLTYFLKRYSFDLGFDYIADESIVPNGADGLKLTPQDARLQVDSFLQSNGFADYSTSAVYLTKPDMNNKGEQFAYIVTCGQSFNGAIQRVIGETAWSKPTKDDYEKGRYAGTWTYEKMYFYIDDTGIIGMRWISPSEVVEVVTEDTTLLPYESIIEIFEKMMVVVYEANANLEYVKRLEYKIDRIALELQRVSEQNSIETGLLIPVWNFYGSFEWKYKGSSPTTSEEMTENFPWSFLSINAIDGSIIDTAKGY